MGRLLANSSEMSDGSRLLIKGEIVIFRSITSFSPSWAPLCGKKDKISPLFNPELSQPPRAYPKFHPGGKFPSGVALECTEAAPDLTLIDLEGTVHSLVEQRCQKIVILDFWATWCQPCVSLMPALQELHDTYGDQGLEIWAVSVGENSETVSSFMTAAGYTFTALLDSMHVAADDYGVTGIPRQFIIDASGEVQIDLQGKTQIMDFEYEDVLPGLLEELPE